MRSRDQVQFDDDEMTTMIDDDGDDGMRVRMYDGIS